MMRLGPTERMVLLILANGGALPCNAGLSWYPLSEDQVYAAINRLGRRSLVDVAGFEGRSRTFKITTKGMTAITPWVDEEDPIEGS